MHPGAAVLRQLFEREAAGVSERELTYQNLRDQAGWEPWLATRLEELDPAEQSHATWLLLRSAVDHTPAEETLRRTLAAAFGLEDWTARLHVCQLFARVACPADLVDDAFDVFVPWAGDRRSFIRGWALSAIHRLGVDHAPARAEAGERIKQAVNDPSKAVRARLRQLTPLSTPEK